MPGNYTLRKTYVDGDILSASDYMADNQQHIDNQTPQATDDYSANVSQMRTVTDTGDENSESLATSLAGELERLRYVINHIKTTMNGSTVTQWYSKSYSLVVSNGTVTTAKLADGATFVQYVRKATPSSNIVTTSETSLDTQGITMTRSRVLTKVIAQLSYTKTGVADCDITVRIKRGGTTIASAIFIATGAGGAIGNLTAVVEFMDNPGTGTFTYGISALKSGTDSATVLGVNPQIMLQEIA
jgi:hypothetical protein